MQSLIKESTLRLSAFVRLGVLFVFCGFIFLLLSQCMSAKSEMPIHDQDISADMTWGERMAESIMKRHKRAWQIEDRNDKKWSYTHGLVSLSMLNLWKETKNEKYFEYAKGYADDMINENGEIFNYQISEFNIDHINPGKILFPIYKRTKDQKYLTALQTLRKQIQWQPRNTKGGFWHKLRYPWQMWLDGLYMGSPFYAEYAVEFDEPESFDDIANQFILIEKYARDNKTGLLYHGWDESHVQRWSNKETGLSTHFWGRSMGWFAMALVDVLDYFPSDHPKRGELLAILQRVGDSMASVQDEETGLWFQVLNMGGKEGNYLEATVTSMMAYFYLKSVNQGYLDHSYITYGEKAFNGLIENLVEVTNDGEIHLHKCCAVAGLGGNPYRDGSYEYYINETIRSNDPKGTGPFILASIEYEKADNNQ